MRRGRILLISGVVSFAFCILGQKSASPEVASGKGVYEKRCAVCHGVDGKGDGLAQSFLYPKPRDLTAGKFKIRSTPSGSLPTDEDLLKTITNGVTGTSMPSWMVISEKERRALVEYIKTFDERFKTQPPAKPIAIGTPPTRTTQLLVKGKQLYEDAGCFECHGTTGKGDGPSARNLKDDWGNPITAYDFTKGGRYKGGSSILDIYRTFMTGMTGTPMPSYADSLAEDQRWALAYYVASLSRQPAGPVPVEGGTVVSKFTKGGLAALDPASPAWERAPATDVLLRPLWLKEGYVDRVRVRSLHNGKEIAFLLEWDDPVMNAAVQRTEDFRDAAAVQFPITSVQLHGAGQPEPPYLMGDAQGPVNIWQWKADREGNGRVPVENLAAAGFGTLTTQLSQDVKGKGIWTDGKWRVALSRAMAGGGEVAEFAPGKVMPIAFSVWNGAMSQVDGEKSLSTWSYLEIEALRKGE
jgi:DMSO reductase family type II enzyme heme b subunit